MGIVKAFTGAISGTFADQWKDIVTAAHFNEYTVVAPGILKQPVNGRGTQNKATPGVLSNGSKIFVPENTAAFIFSQSGIEDIIATPGGYEYQSGQDSIFNRDGVVKSVFGQVASRVGYGGQTADEKKVAFVNMREIRSIRFGTKGPVMYNDLFYQADLEIVAFGSFSVQVFDPEKFIRNFVPPNTLYYSLDDQKVRAQILSEFLQSFIDSLNTLSSKYRISQLPSQANEIAKSISDASSNAGTWGERYGFDIIGVGIESIEFTPASRELVNKYSETRMNWRALEDISQQTSNIAAQQKIAQGVQDHGMGDMPGMMFGMGMVQNLNPMNATVNQTSTPQPEQPSAQPKGAISLDEQIEALKKLKELMDAGILSQEEFDSKKKEIMGL